jgi:hypothetical protein
MPRFSVFFSLGLTQPQLDFVDVSNDYDTPVYVDPYAIEIRDDIWAAKASDAIRTFFLEVLDALRSGDTARAKSLMSHLHEPRETFLGVSSGVPKGLGVGSQQSGQLISALRNSRAFKTGMLTDLSEVALYIEGIDRDKISDLTTNIIRELLVEYTNQQCSLFGIPTRSYNGPPFWDTVRKNWVSKFVNLPFLGDDAVLLVPKYIVRKNLSLNSQEFYNKQMTDFLVAENLRANSSLVQTVKGEPKVYKKDVREQQSGSKDDIANFVSAHPEVLTAYKDVAKKFSSLSVFNDDDPSVHAICARLADLFDKVPSGAKHADNYHRLVLGALTALFYPDLIQPHKEWEINDGRKRVDIVFTNAADTGFFAQRRDDHKVNANTVIVECKNYSSDINNPELDQLLGRFDDNRGKFGLLTCRAVDDTAALQARCRDAAVRSQGYMLVLTDDDLKEMLTAKAMTNDELVQSILHKKYRELLS